MNHPLVKQLIATIETTEAESRALDEALIDAAFLLEKSRGLHHAGWPDHVQSAAVTTEHAQSLKRAVAAYVRRCARGCWALGKSADPAQRDTLANALRAHLAPGGDPFELYQALVALEDCGETDVFAGATCRSSIHAEANRQYARRYLARRANSPTSAEELEVRAAHVSV